MRKAIDAHVHILPETMLGRTDSALKTKAEKFGIFVYENGETCRRVPPYFESTSFSTEALLATIGQFGVEKAVILQSFTFRINEEVAEAVAKYPDKLKGAMVIDPRDEDSVAQMRFWHKRGLTVLKFEMSTVQGFSHPRAYPEMRFDGADVMKLFDEAEKLGITVAVDPSPVFGNGYQVDALKKAIETHPKLRFVICHLCFAMPDYLNDGKKRAEWERMCALASYDNVWVDLAAMCDLFLGEEYPFPGSLDMLNRFIDRYGDDKVIWGSDIPGSLNSATYREMMDMFEKHSGLSEQSKNKLFYENALKAYF